MREPAGTWTPCNPARIASPAFTDGQTVSVLVRCRPGGHADIFGHASSTRTNERMRKTSGEFVSSMRRPGSRALECIHALCLRESCEALGNPAVRSPLKPFHLHLHLHLSRNMQSFHPNRSIDPAVFASRGDRISRDSGRFAMTSREASGAVKNGRRTLAAIGPPPGARAQSVGAQRGSR